MNKKRMMSHNKTYTHAHHIWPSRSRSNHSIYSLSFPVAWWH